MTALVVESLQDGRPVALRVAGSSMSPFIRQGDRITLTPVSLSELSPGMVIGFTRDQRHLVIHRYLGLKEALLITRGDAVGHDDGGITENDLLGRVNRVERNGRRLRLGLGPEGRWIAWFSRLGLLVPLLEPGRRLFRLLRRSR